jgi:hypothetical protein
MIELRQTLTFAKWLAVFAIGQRKPVFRFAWIGWRSDLSVMHGP